ncbi:MAG: hypothetical protein DI528_18485 [Shinella sp.]|nr:MAG: hypothetical protein DI528_18485 [Shinella sp.]
MNSYLFRAARPFSRWRVRPFPGEGAFSYFHRLVRDQEDCHPRTYADALGIPSTKIGARHVLEAVLKLPITAEQKTSLERWTPLPVDGHFTLNGIPLHHRIIPLCTQKYCPTCIEQAPFHRAWWDIEGYETCPFHRTPMQRWPGIKEQGNWPPFYGHEVTRPSGDQAQENHDRNSFEGYLLRRVGFLQQRDESMPLLDPSLLDDVIWYSSTLGRLLRNPRLPSRPPSTPHDFQTGFEALRRDRDHLAAAISEWLVANNTPEELAKGTSYSLGWSSAFAQSKWHRKKASSMLGKEIILAQTIACAKVGTVGFARLGRAETKIWPISLKSARKSLGVTERSIEFIARDAGVRFEPQATHRVVDETQFRAMSEYVKRLISAKAALAALGCTQAQLDRLSWHGFIRRIKFAGRDEAAYLGDDIDSILDRISALPECRGDEITLEEAARRRLSWVSAMMAAFLRGEYRCSRSATGVGFSSLRLPADIPTARAKRRGKPQKVGRKHPSDKAMLRTEFMTMAHLDGACVTALASNNHIQVMADDDPRLLRESALAFHRRYVNPALYLDTHINVWRRHLEELGVPVLFSDICTNLIVERSRFEAATGLVTLSVTPDAAARWREMRDSFAKHAPSFIVPEELGNRKVVVRTTAIKARFTLHIQGDHFLFERKFLPQGRSREWALYVSNPAGVRKALEDFEWSDAGEGHIATLVASSRGDFDRAAIAFGRLCDMLRVKQPMIRREKSE